MDTRRFSPDTQRNWIRDIGRLATFLGRAPNTATAHDLRRFQVEQQVADAVAYAGRTITFVPTGVRE
jgi:integrase/recombinase XerD